MLFVSNSGPRLSSKLLLCYLIKSNFIVPLKIHSPVARQWYLHSISSSGNCVCQL